MKYKLLMFDMDGTLIEPFDAITKGVKYALERFNIKIKDRRELLPFIGPPLRVSLSSFAPQLNEAEREELIKIYHAHFAEKGLYMNKLYSGILECLDALSKSGAVLTVATSKYEVNAQKICDLLGLTKYFELVVGAYADGRRGDKSEVVAHVLETMLPKGFKLEDIVMIGDRKYDVAGASPHKIPTIGVSWGYGSREELLEAGAAHIVDTPEELYKFILK